MKIIGRAVENSRFTTWLHQAEKRTEIFHLSGIGGIGKTTLALSFVEQAKRENALSVWIDGSATPATPFAIFSEMEAILQHQYGRVRELQTPLSTFLLQEFSRRATLLIFDRFEKMSGIEEWLLYHFFENLPLQGVLLVITSRRKVPTKWTAHPRWASRIQAFELDCWTRDESLQFLDSFPLSDTAKLRIAQKAEGYPLLLSLLTSLESAGEDLDRLTPLADRLSAELLKEALKPSVYEVLKVLSLFPFATRSMLQPLLPRPLEPLFDHEIGNFTFIRKEESGLSLHPVVSHLLREEWNRTDPDRYHEMREQAVRILADRFTGMNHSAKLQTTTHVLEIYRESLPVQHPYADFISIRLPIAYHPLRIEERNDLHRLLASSIEHGNWQSEWVKKEEYHTLLEEIALHSPEGILPVRSEEGDLLAFLAGIWLHRNNLQLLGRYTPQLIEAIVQREGIACCDIPSGQADTLLILMSAVDDRHPSYRAEELGSLMTQAWLTHMTMGRRGIVPTNDPNLTSLLTHFGFREYGAPSMQNQEGKEPAMWALDFRHAFFLDWVETVLRQMKSTSVPATKSHVDEKRTVIPLPIIQQILRHLHETDALDEILHRIPGYRFHEMSGHKVGQYLRWLLSEEAMNPPLTREERSILRESYLSREKSKTELADSFHMSRTTFYRHSQQALKKLSHLLSQYLSGNT